MKLCALKELKVLGQGGGDVRHRIIYVQLSNQQHPSIPPLLHCLPAQLMGEPYVESALRWYLMQWGPPRTASRIQMLPCSCVRRFEDCVRTCRTPSWITCSPPLQQRRPPPGRSSRGPPRCSQERPSTVRPKRRPRAAPTAATGCATRARAAPRALQTANRCACPQTLRHMNNRVWGFKPCSQLVQQYSIIAC